jgi:serine protease Do
VSRDGISLRPVFVGALHDIDAPLWSEPIWALPNTTDLAPNTFVFTPDGAFAGLVVDVDDRLALVPGETVRSEVDRLRREGTRAWGQLGVEVQALTPAVATGVGARTGVVVTWVDPRGPAAEYLSVMDVIEALADEPLSTFAAWHARAARLVAGQTISLRVRRDHEVRTVMLTAQAASTPGPPSLGLTMRSLQKGGVEVLVVAQASAGERAGIQPGDVITVVGDRDAPTPAQVRRLFSMATEARPLLIALTRGAAHHVLALETR